MDKTENRDGEKGDTENLLQPVGTLGSKLNEEIKIKGTDSYGKKVEWIVKPTGNNSFELTVPEGIEAGDPNAWESISIMTQRVFSGDQGCTNQCGCQGNNCGAQGNLVPEIKLKPGGI